MCTVILILPLIFRVRSDGVLDHIGLFAMLCVVNAGHRHSTRKSHMHTLGFPVLKQCLSVPNTEAPQSMSCRPLLFNSPQLDNRTCKPTRDAVQPTATAADAPEAKAVFQRRKAVF